MNRLRAPLYLACFATLALVATVVAARAAGAAVVPVLLAAVAAGVIAGAPGMLRARAWPAALLLLPLGAYVLARLQVPVPPGLEGARAQFVFFASELQAGALIYARDVFPLDVTGSAGLQLLLSLVVYSAVWAAAFFTLSLRRPLPGVIVLLVLVGFGFTVDGATYDLWPALAFVALAGGLLVVSSALRREHLRPAEGLAGGLTVGLAAVFALSLLGATAVEAGRPLQDWRDWDLGGSRSDRFRFDFMQNYPRLLDPANDEVVMRVRSQVPSYWRANVLDAFDGSAWRSSLPAGAELRPSAVDGSWVYAVPPQRPAPQGESVIQRFEIQRMRVDRLLVGGWATEVRAPKLLRLRAGDVSAIALAQHRGSTLSYSVTAVVPDPGPSDLTGRGKAYPADVAARYLSLPFPARVVEGRLLSEQEWLARASSLQAGREWRGLYALSERVVGAETDPYLVALAVEQYLRSSFSYTLRPPDAGYGSPYAEFLFANRAGYCQHFAGAMAAILRFNGVPARVVLGFTTGDKEQEDVWSVSSNDAHAWVEAYFPGAGWTSFEPTPGRSAPVAGGTPASGPDAAVAAGLAQDEAESARDSADEAARARAADPGGAGGGGGAEEVSGGRAPWLLALLLLPAAWPAGRALLRRRGLIRGSREDRLSASVSLLYADLRDHGVEAPPSETLDETAQRLQGRLGVDAGDLPARLQAIAFGGRPVTDADLQDLALLRRRVHRRLRKTSGRLTAVLALYGIRKPAGARGMARPGIRAHA
jgi:transglutaminase-like putative cysteine protease